MEEQQPQYNDFQMFLGITAGLAAGAIAGTLLASAISKAQTKPQPMVKPEDWRKYFNFLAKTTQNILKDFPGILDEMKQQTNKDYHQLEESN
ncbi:MAG TPA: hypothetical protein VMR41_01255 [Patescibacteria group bacterium]|nr:hypothetical protein [Patescibacteria group bacterium]